MTNSNKARHCGIGGSPLELNQLKQFHTIAEEGTIASAAEKLYTSPSALSKGLQKLEDDLGVQLFNRGKKRIELNDAGKIALPYVEQIFETIAAMQYELQAHADNCRQNILHIASDEAYLLRFIIPLLAKQVPITSISEQLEQAPHLEKGLRCRKFDVALSEQSLRGKGLVCRELFVSKLYVSIPEANPLAGKGCLRLLDLSDQEFLIPSNSVQNVINTLKKERKPLRFRIVDDYTLYRDILSRSDYLSLVGTTSLAFHRSIPGRVIRVLDDAAAFQTRAYYIYLEKNEQKVLPFIRWAEQTFSGRG